MSEVVLPAPVKAKYVSDLLDDTSTAVPGAFTYYTMQESGDTPRGMIYACPCGCGRLGSLAFNPPSADDVKHKRHTWQWDGNREQPTLTPSVHHVGHWHGWLRAGQWVQA